jgi:Heterokaryon incompatibility protein (HET)
METSSYATILLIKDWLRTCSNEHSQCAIPPLSALPMRALDVSNYRVKLVETKGMIAPYITLSHCWGLKPIIRLLKSNTEDLKKEIPWTALSKTFQDAIVITWKLGFRYIWIDALCILQDGIEDWEFHASKMASIFSNSQLTISASSGADGSKGCFSSRLKEPYVLHSYDSREIRNPLLWVPHQLEGRDREDCLKTFTVRLKTPHGLYQNRRPKEPLLKRAWVFQEQILSPRIVHFASGELYFECKSHIACECSGWSLRFDSYQWETRWRKAHTTLVGQRIQSLHASETEQMTHKRAEFEAYRALVETYTELDITAELDRLPALSGITFGRNDEYLAGIWRSLLIESLHWYPVSKSLRGIMARRPFNYRAPTWSWASIEAPVKHIEKDFYRTKFSARYVAKIMDASTTPTGLNPRGRVTGGYLRIQGPMGEARVTAIGTCEREGSAAEEMQKTMAKIRPDSIDPSLSHQDSDHDLCTYATLQRDGKEGRCYLDLPLALCRVEPAEVAIGEELMLLVVSSITIMVLKAVPDTPGSYTRVGLFRPKEEGWWFDQDRGSIFVI